MSEDQRKNQGYTLITVLATSDVATLVMAKSALEALKIPYLDKGEMIQSLFGLGRIGINAICGPVELQVAADDYDKAMDALRGVFGNEEALNEREDDS